MNVGRQQRTVAVLGLQHTEVLDRQCGGGDKSVGERSILSEHCAQAKADHTEQHES